MWDILIAVSYLCAFFLDPFLFGFWYEPLMNWEARQVCVILCLIMLADSILTPFVGVPKKETPQDDDEEEQAEIENETTGNANKRRRGNVKDL